MRILERDTRLMNSGASLGTIYIRLAHAELLLLFVTRCLGMPKEQWAGICAILPLANILHILGSYLTEKLRHRKWLYGVPFLLARFAVPAIMVLPFLHGTPGFNYYYLLIALFIHAGLCSMGMSPWYSWIADIVPPGSRGRFWSKRFIATNACDAVFMILGGVMLDYFAARNGGGYANPHSYLIIFGFAFVVGQIDIILHLLVKERRMHVQEEPLKFVKLTLEPWTHKDYRKFMFARAFMAIMDGTMAAPFAALYLFDEIGFSATDYGIMMMLFLFANTVCFHYWQKFGDRVGYRTVLTASSTVAGVFVVMWWFLPYKHIGICFFSIALSFMMAGVGMSGVNLAFNTLALNVAPEKNRSMFSGQVAVVYAIGVAFAIFLVRLLYVYTNPTTEIVLWGTKITGVHAVVGVLALTRIIGGMWVVKMIPDRRSEQAAPILANMLRKNPLRILKIMEGAPVPEVDALDPSAAPPKTSG